MRFILACALCISGCSKTTPAPSPSHDAASPVDSVSAKSAAPTFTTYRFSGFSMGDGVLEECMDSDMTLQHPLDGGRASAFPESVTKGLTEIQSTCSEQFADRTVLASCTIECEDPDGSKRVVRQAHYSTNLIASSDALMKTCLEMKGKWASVRRDSLEWNLARADEVRRKLKAEGR